MAKALLEKEKMEHGKQDTLLDITKMESKCKNRYMVKQDKKFRKSLQKSMLVEMMVHI